MVYKYRNRNISCRETRRKDGLEDLSVDDAKLSNYSQTKAKVVIKNQVK